MKKTMTILAITNDPGTGGGGGGGGGGTGTTIGTAGNDVLVGTSAADSMRGYGGSTYLRIDGNGDGQLDFSVALVGQQIYVALADLGL